MKKFKNFCEKLLNQFVKQAVMEAQRNAWWF